MTKLTIDLFYIEAKKYMEELAEKHNVEAEISKFSIGEGNSFYFSVKGHQKSQSGKSHEQELFESYCGRYGFKPSDYKKSYISFDGKGYEFIGFSPRAKKYHYLVRSLSNGKIYKSSYVNITKD